MNDFVFHSSRNEWESEKNRYREILLVHNENCEILIFWGENFYLFSIFAVCCLNYSNNLWIDCQKKTRKMPLRFPPFNTYLELPAIFPARGGQPEPLSLTQSHEARQICNDWNRGKSFRSTLKQDAWIRLLRVYSDPASQSDFCPCRLSRMETQFWIMNSPLVIIRVAKGRCFVEISANHDRIMQNMHSTKIFMGYWKILR